MHTLGSLGSLGSLRSSCLVFTAQLALFLLLPVAPAGAQTARPFEDTDLPVEFDKTDMSGPRFGVTYVVGDGIIADRLEENDMQRVLSQFGWHFERRVTPQGGGPQFVVQAVPMIAAWNTVR